MSDDDFDNIPDDFANVHGVDWAQILGAGSSAATSSTHHETPETLPSPVPPNLPDSNDSSYFSDDGDMDTAFLAELDRLEETLTAAPSASTSGQPGVNVLQTATNSAPSNSEHNSGRLAPQPQSHPISEGRNLHRPRSSIPQTASSIQNVEANSKRDGEHASNVPSKRPRIDDSSTSISPRSKGKLKADDNLQQILSSYEDEFTCPICCDLFVASHVGNPCGHNVCGDCGLQWHQNTENKSKGCPCCRGTLDAVTPMIPNISMDNTVEKHVQALALSGMQEWGPSGQKYKDWNTRKKAWRDGAKKREKTKTLKPPQRNRSIVSLGTIHVFDAPEEWFHPEDNLEEEPTREDSDVELIPRPVRVRRRRVRRPVQ